MNKTQTNATARPWKQSTFLIYHDNGPFRDGVAHTGFGQQKSVKIAEANAALIVRAVNLFDALEAVAEAASNFERLQSSNRRFKLAQALAALNKLKEEQK